VAPPSVLYAWFQVPHGCNGADMNQVIVTFPNDWVTV
jgi:uncharacterized protein YcnI